MATMRTPVLALGHYLQVEAWPNRVERLVIEHDFVVICLSFSLLSRFAMPGFLEYVHDGIVRHTLASHRYVLAHSHVGIV